MAEGGLAQAKAKFDEAKALYDVSGTAIATIDDPTTSFEVYTFKMQEALYVASEALVASRREGNSEGKVSALEIVVQTQLALNDDLSALTAVQDELAMIRRTGDKEGKKKMLDILLNVQSTRGDTVPALESAEELLAASKELGDRVMEAKALRYKASLRLDLGKKREAMAPAEEALDIAKDLGSKEAEEAAQRVISNIYTVSEMPNKAPNRQEALDALQDLANAIASTDQQAWNKATDVLNNTCAFTQKDVDDVVSKAIEKDQKNATAFLQEQGISTKGAEPTGALHVYEVVKRMTYIGFRIGGLGYGPRFRCLQGYGMAQGGVPVGALCALQVSDEADDWERELCYQPGLLDGMLQSGSAYVPA